MSSSIMLSEEVLLLAFEQLLGEGRPSLDLKNLRLTCRQFRPAATTLLFRHVTVCFPLRTREEDLQDPVVVHSQGLLAFLHEHDKIRAQVITMSIHGQSDEHEARDVLELQDSLIELLPLLERLRHIRISRIGATRAPSDSSSALLEAIQKLQPPVLLSIGQNRKDCAHYGFEEDAGYIHTFNPQLLLDRITCLESLQVHLLNAPDFPRHGGSMYSSFEGIPSQDIAETVRQNPKLKDLCLFLNATNHASQQHELLPAESEYALDNLGNSVQSLRSLTLQGDFHFTHSTWFCWGNESCAGLEELSLLTESLTREMTTYIVGRCPALKSLRLGSPLHNSQRDRVHNGEKFQTDVTSFLASCNLAELALNGFHPKNLEALKESGSSVRRLLFHVSERPTLWARQGLPHVVPLNAPRYTDVLLSPTRLQDLQVACPSLEWLAMDILPFHLKDDAESTKLHTPMFGHPESDQRAFHETISDGYPNSNYMIAARVYQMFGWKEEIADPIFTALTNFRSLRHLRLFKHNVDLYPWSFGLDDAIRTFFWLQEHKEGASLESLVIYVEPSFMNPYADDRNSSSFHGKGSVGAYIVYEMGKGRVFAEHDGTTILYAKEEDTEKPGELKELWRKDVAPDMGLKYQERWQRLDREGHVVPISWI